MLKCTFQKCFLFFAAVQRPSLAGAVSASLRNPNCSEKVHSFRKYLICEKISRLSENIHSFRKYSHFQEKFTLLKKHCYRSSNLERKFKTNFGFTTKVRIWNKHRMLQELHISSTEKYSSSSRQTRVSVK